jgi:hypothetical protein
LQEPPRLAWRAWPLPAGLLVTLMTAGAACWRLRFRPSPETQAWQRGVEGERHVARLLALLVQAGWGVSHDVRVPDSKANIDHVVIGPPGVFVIDAEHYRGRLHLSRDGLLWHGRTFLAPTPSATRWEADKLQARIGTPDIAVVPIVAVLGAMVPDGQVTALGVTVIPARKLLALLRSLPPTLTPERARKGPRRSTGAWTPIPAADPAQRSTLGYHGTGARGHLPVALYDRHQKQQSAGDEHDVDAKARHTLPAFRHAQEGNENPEDQPDHRRMHVRIAPIMLATRAWRRARGSGCRGGVTSTRWSTCSPGPVRSVASGGRCGWASSRSSALARS